MSSPNSSARRQLFSPGGTQKRSPTKPIPIAPKPPQRGVTITPLKLELISSILQQQQQLQAGAAPVGQQAPTIPQVTPTTQAASSPSRQPPQESLAGSSAQLVVPSTASTGTQTSPLRRPPAPPTSFQSPTKGINIASMAELMSGTVPMSPGNPTVGSFLSPSRVTSPPVPTVIVPSPAKTPQKGSHSATPSATTPSATTPGATQPRPKRSGSLTLFYRKVYPLAFIRIKDLCDRLGFHGEAMQK